MTPIEIQRRIAEIAARVDDDEAMHSMEDDLRADVLRAIADGSVPLHMMSTVAAEVLKTDDLHFSRWCA